MIDAKLLAALRVISGLDDGFRFRDVFSVVGGEWTRDMEVEGMLDFRNRVSTEVKERCILYVASKIEVSS